MSRPFGAKNGMRLSDEERKERNIASVLRYHQNHPERILENAGKSRRKNLYKMTEEDYAKLLSFQDGKCAICGADNRGRALYIDHNHKTGKIRGLLCTSCNTALGLVYDDVTLLEKMIVYLKGDPYGNE